MILVLGESGFLGQNVKLELDSRKIPYTGSSLGGGVDLRDIESCRSLFLKVKPEVVINCAAVCGGIVMAMSDQADSYISNMKIIQNIYECAQEFKVKKIINPISNCVYPCELDVFKEELFWSGELHPSVYHFAFTRKSIVVISDAFNKQYGMNSINIVLSNMYGPLDHFDEKRSHALGALLMRIVEAKREMKPSVTVWGSGKPVREWLFVKDAARALVNALEVDEHVNLVNIGIEKGNSIRELAETISKVVGYKGMLEFDTSKPDGALIKTVDGSKGDALLSWAPATSLEVGIKETVGWYQDNLK